MGLKSLEASMGFEVALPGRQILISLFLRFAAPVVQCELNNRITPVGVIHYLQGNWGSSLGLTMVTLVLKVQVPLKFWVFKVAKAVCGL